MRPVSKGASPVNGDFGHYRDSFDYLLDRVGIGEFNGMSLAQYCSYCERVIPTNLAVEHIEPKNGQFAQAHLRNRWSNFLLSCVNCNSKKGSGQVDFQQLFFPDRDNTYHAFEYSYQGDVEPSRVLNDADRVIAQNTIDLFGLNDAIDSDLEGVAKDRRTQRLNAYSSALSALEDYESSPDNPAMVRMIVKGMVGSGYFSIWMKAFENYPSIRNQFVDALRGTRLSGCFDENSQSVSPHPNADALVGGGKI
ncbi:conserved hypothetical protein [Vibrio chagasii]|nr:conserved hypothetical protein [Vibrio chagasii]